MAQMPKAVMDALADPGAMKMVGTVSSSGVPNAVIVNTMAALDPEAIAFADLRLGKTKANLNETGKLTVTVLRPNREAYQIKCSFQGFEETSPLAAEWNEMIYGRMRIQIKAVGIGKVEEVYSACLADAGAKLA